MRQCVTKEGTVDVTAWQALGEDVTAREFVQLERVALYTATMQWETTDFYREWSKTQPGPGMGGPGSGTNDRATPFAVQQSQSEQPPPVDMPSREELLAVLRRARLLGRQAQKEGIDDATDPVQWLASKGVDPTQWRVKPE